MNPCVCIDAFASRVDANGFSFPFGSVFCLQSLQTTCCQPQHQCDGSAQSFPNTSWRLSTSEQIAIFSKLLIEYCSGRGLQWLHMRARHITSYSQNNIATLILLEFPAHAGQPFGLSRFVHDKCTHMSAVPSSRTSRIWQFPDSFGWDCVNHQRCKYS